MTDDNINETTTQMDTGAADGQAITAPETDASVQSTETGVGQAEQSGTDSAGDNFGLTNEQLQQIKTNPLLDQAYKSMQSGFTKKMQEASQSQKSLTFEEFVQDPARQLEIQQWIQSNTPVDMTQQQNQSMQSYVDNWGKMNQHQQLEVWNALDDSQKVVLKTALESSATKRAWQLMQMQQEDNLNIQTYGDAYKKLTPQINQRYSSGKGFSAAEVFKALNYDNAIKESYEKGLKEAFKNRQPAMNANVSGTAGGLGKTSMKGGSIRERMEAVLNGIPASNLSKTFQ